MDRHSKIQHDIQKTWECHDAAVFKSSFLNQRNLYYEVAETTILITSYNKVHKKQNEGKSGIICIAFTARKRTGGNAASQ